MPKRSRKETINDWLTRRHQLIVRNEENFEEKRTITYNNSKVIVLVFVIFITIFFSAILLDRYYFSEWGGAMRERNLYKRELAYLSLQVDSLESSAFQKEKYMNTLKIILDGGDPDLYLNEDSLATTSNENFDPNIPSSQVDREIREEFEGSGSSDIGLSTDSRLSDVILFAPVDGFAISKKYSPREGHFGLDILTKENQVVSTVADGMIIFSEWTIDGGNTVLIQHNNDLISVYKHTAVLLKKPGDFVKSGDAIAIVGNSGKETSGHHLHFEIWFDGEPFNPENMISF